MKRGLAVTTMLLLIPAVLWAPGASARDGGEGFASGSRAARGVDAGSSLAQLAPEQGTRSRPRPDAPVTRTPPKPWTWKKVARGLLMGGVIGSVFLGRGFKGIGLLEVMILSALIVLAFRALSRYQAAPPGRRYPAAGTAPGDNGPDALARGVSGIQQADPSFDPAGFARVVDGAFRKVQAAWTARDMARAADVLSVEMRETLDKQCERLRGTRRINRVENITLRRAAIVEIRQEHGWDRITVHIVASLIDYTTDEAGQRVLEGNPFEPVELQERWEFLRLTGPYPWRVSSIQ